GAFPQGQALLRASGPLAARTGLDVGVVGSRGAAPAEEGPAEAHMILPDTNAVLYLLSGHRKGRVLLTTREGLAFSPVSLLELQLIQEIGRGAFTTRDPARAARSDPRWTVDDPPVDALVERALPLSWTRDPFDRLIAAHALYRGWRLATSDQHLVRNLPARASLPL